MSLKKIVESGNVNFVKWILEEFDVDTSRVVLHDLCKLCSVGMLELLVAHGVDVNKFHDGETAFHAAIRVRFTNPIGILYDHANVNLTTSNGETPLYLSVITHNFGLMRRLLDDPRIDVNVKDNVGDTILHDVCRRQLINLIKVFLERDDIDVNAQNDDGETPLMTACCSGNVSIAETLLTRTDINPTLIDNNGKTIHEYIVDTNSEYLMTLLQAVLAN